MAEFAAEFGITYPLLSDPDSEIIREVGILNTLIPDDDHPWFGIPFPGTYVLDAEGCITAKVFEHSLAFRPGPEALLHLASGGSWSPEPGRPVESVEVDVHVEGGPIAPGQLRELVVRLRVPPGQHVYGEPVPDGMVATDIALDPLEGLVVRPIRRPATRSHTLAGTGDVLQVYDGDVELRLPFTHAGSVVEAQRDGTFRLSGTVRWQACDDDVCGLPGRHSFDLEVVTGRINRPHGGDGGGMDTSAHLARMVARRSP